MQYPLYIVEVVAFFLFKERRDLINPLCIYYTDVSVLLENIPIVIFIKTTSGIDGVIVIYFPVRHSCLYVIKKANTLLKILHLKFFYTFSCHAIHTRFFKRWRIYWQRSRAHFKSVWQRKFARGHFVAHKLCCTKVNGNKYLYCWFVSHKVSMYVYIYIHGYGMSPCYFAIAHAH